MPQERRKYTSATGKQYVNFASATQSRRKFRVSSTPALAGYPNSQALCMFKAVELGFPASRVPKTVSRKCRMNSRKDPASGVSVPACTTTVVNFACVVLTSFGVMALLLIVTNNVACYLYIYINTAVIFFSRIIVEL